MNKIISNKANMKKNLPFSPPSYSYKELEAVSDCIKNSWTGSGPKVKEFEKNFSKYKKTNFAAAFSSCTSAIFLSLKALGIKEGDQVITTSMTFCSTINCIIHCGAEPILCDIDKETKNISVDEILKKITYKTKAIIPVHYAGYPCEMDQIMNIARENDLYVVEDCAHAIESTFKGKPCGTFGEIGCFSFYATKNIAIGEGGMAISNHENLISNMSCLGLHGLSRDAWKRFSESQRKSYDVEKIGYKMNMTDIQASLGNVQLSRINEMRERRKQIWDFYSKSLKETSLELPNLPSDNSSLHAMHLYAVGLPKVIDKDEFIWKANKEYEITFGTHYQAIPCFSVYKSMFGNLNIMDEFPNAINWGKKTVSLSLSAAVKDEDCERIVNCIKALTQF